jgi:RNA polymerase sigma-70 factor (ECF subfamily)
MTAPRTLASDGHISADALFRLHAPFVARFLFRLGVRPDGIEDAVQEVFLVVHRQGGYRAGAAKPTSYLANLAVYAAAEYRRRQRARMAREADEVVEDHPSDRSDPVQVLETHESLRRLQDALDRLEPDLRTTLVLVELEGETCASIAAAMSIPVGTVYWRLHQARKKFQRALEIIETAGRPRPAIAVQAASLAGGMRPARKERGGMFILLMTGPSWMNSEARDLLRFGTARPPVGYAVQEGLARHLELAASGAPLPSWANKLGTVAKTAGWIAASTVAVAVGATVVLLARPGAHARSPQEWPAPQETSAAKRPTALAEKPTSTSAWQPLVTPGVLPASGTPEVLPAVPSVPVEALPLAPSEPVEMRAPRQPDRRQAASDPASDRSASPTRDPGTDPASDELLELQEVAQAERLLATDPARALALVRAAEARFPAGYVREERDYVELMALVALGRLDEARPKVARFLRDHPDSAFTGRVREASRRARLEP